MSENLVSIKIAPADLTKILEAITTIEQTLRPYLISLTPDQRRELPKMSDKTLPFVNKVLDYIAMKPQFAPAYLNVEELKIDLQAVANLTQIYRSIEPLYENLNDTITRAGSEAYVASLAFYNSVKQAAKMNVPDAKTIFNDLKVRFEKTIAPAKE
ncbi:MAG: hypothetical protein ONB27_05850 [candidate division KSB1 bacterium]|nr:hypothetical protein [candidate division KSB1 bacterium]